MQKQETETSKVSGRELKFRAWDKKNSRMAQVYTLGLTGIEGSTINSGGELLSGCGKENIELMQYTGLKDKNGKEIYEGDIYITDIIRRIGEKIGVEMPVSSEKKQIVEWQRCGFSPIEDEERIEIIGNIYENPELLK